MCCLNVIGTVSFDTGPVQAVLPNSTRNGSARENAPLVRWSGALTPSVASPAVDVTVALVDAVYSRSTPGVNAPNDAAPTDSESVAGTVPPTSPTAHELTGQ